MRKSGVFPAGWEHIVLDAETSHLITKKGDKQKIKVSWKGKV